VFNLRGPYHANNWLSHPIALLTYMGKRTFWGFFSVVLFLGLAAGYRLSALPRLETYKLLNAAGLCYSFFGVLVLAELLASARWKNICVKYLAPAVLYFHALFPFGAYVGAHMSAQLMHKPSSWIVWKFFFGYFSYSMIPALFLDEVVVLPRFPFVKSDIETRWRRFGLFLMLSGGAVQLIAALLSIGEQ
jgi:hypothetical protein